MAAGDLTDLIARVQYRGSFSTSDVGLTSTIITANINAAIKQIASERDWPWQEATATITTANGTKTYAAPTGYLRTDSIVDTAAGELLDQRQLEEIDRSIATGHPLYYAVYADSVVLAPIPDAVYSLNHRYIKAETALSSGADLPLIPRANDEGIVEWATMLCHMFARQDAKAAEAKARYDLWLAATQDSVDRNRKPRRAHSRVGTGTLADLEARLILRAGLDSDSATLTQTTRINFLNAALKQIAAERDWPWLFATETITTASGTATYSSAATWVRTDSIIDTVIGEPLVERQTEEIARYITSDRPVCYALDADVIRLGPTPDGVYSLSHRYVKKENTLSVATSTPLIPNAFDEGVVEWAAALAHDFLGQSDKAGIARDRYKLWLRTVQDTVDRTRRPRRVQVRAGAVW